MVDRLTSNTNTWSRTEWKKGPAHRFKGCPTLRLKLMCVGSVDVLSSVEGIGINFNESTLGNKHLGLTIRAPSTRYGRVLVGEASIPRNNWIKSQHLYSQQSQEIVSRHEIPSLIK